MIGEYKPPSCTPGVIVSLIQGELHNMKSKNNECPPGFLPIFFYIKIKMCLDAGVGEYTALNELKVHKMVSVAPK